NYTVSNVVSGKQLATLANGKLAAVRATDGNRPRRAWTLRPTNDGTWMLASRASTHSVRVLLP
ncbi:MAG TPA: hypothetical protein VF635_17455, partial [Propionibacteriaceae bacterium]